MFPNDTRKRLENIINGIVLQGKKIISQQPETSYAQAIAQVQKLKKTSTVNQQLKKSRAKS